MTTVEGGGGVGGEVVVVVDGAAEDGDVGSAVADAGVALTRGGRICPGI